jgi:hypothetical protein
MKVAQYEKPLITTIEIPERTSYACNIHGDEGCPHISNIVGHGICTSTNSLSFLGVCA